MEFSYSALEDVLKLPDAEVYGVMTLGEAAFNSDFRSVEDVANDARVPCLFWEFSARIVDRMAAQHPAAIYCFGWSRLER